MEKNKNEFNKITDLMEIMNKANELAEAVKERSDDDILLDLAKDIKTLIINF